MTMTTPLFQAAQRGQSYVEPDHDQIEREQDAVLTEGRGSVAPPPYIPLQVSPDELDRIKEEMRLNRTQITPDTLRHALEAEEIRKFLRRWGVRSLRKVAATRDFRGVVKLDFEEFRTLVERLMEADPDELDERAGD
jgi:hypothetical protein